MYPSGSDWTNGTPLSAWFTRRLVGGEPTVCQTDGWNFLRDLEEQLQSRGASIDINPDAGWTPQVLQSLATYASQDNAPGTFITSINFDAGSGVITPTTLQVAIWEAYLNQGSSDGNPVFGLGSPTEAEIPPGAILPSVGVMIPRPPSGVTSSGLNCQPLSQLPGGPTQANIGLIPFQFNPWVIFGVAAAGLAAMLYATRDVPIHKRTKRK